jgi:hypothetical protein
MTCLLKLDRRTGTARATADPYRMTNKRTDKGKDKRKDNGRGQRETTTQIAQRREDF